jgi:hypothetical protein
MMETPDPGSSFIILSLKTGKEDERGRWLGSGIDRSKDA